jgi:hypothetical protein
MGLAIGMAVTVTPPVATGVLVWWGVMLAAPIVFIRRWRRRRGGAPRRRLRPSAVGGRQSKASPPSPAGRRSGHAASGRLAADRGRLADDADILTTVGAVPTHGETPPPRAGSQADSIPAVGLSAETLEPLCRYVDFRRRLELAVAELERRLSGLPADRWRVEPYPLTGARGNKRLLLGQTGVFVISATYAPGHWDDVVVASTLARKVQLLLPGYPGQVQAAICHLFASTRPRLWHRPDEHRDWVGAWVVGGDWLIEWLEHFGPEHGLGAADLAHFAGLAEPDWLKPAIPTPPSWPPIPEAAPPRSQP